MNSLNSDYQFKCYSHNGSISYIILPIRRLNEALKVLINGFYPYENWNKALETAKNPKAVQELNELVIETVKDGVSIVAVDNTADEIIGISVNKIQKKESLDKSSFFEDFLANRCTQKESAALVKAMIDCDSDVNIFEHYNVDKVMEIIFLAVLPHYRANGIGTELVKSDLVLLTELSKCFNGPKLATALWTSNYTSKIGNKLNFKVIATRNVDKMEYNGIRFSNKIGNEHHTVKLAVKKIDEK